MYIAPTLNISITDLKIDEDGRYVIFKGDFQGMKILFGNFYFPTWDKEKEQLKFLNILEKKSFQKWGLETMNLF